NNFASRVPLQDMTVGARLLRHLPPYLRRRIGVDEARATMASRLKSRNDDFLSLVRGAIYENPETPYQQLLKLAGCEYGDLERLVRKDGVEGALSHLYRSGVYLTIDEYKGRRPTIRGSATLSVEPSQLRNPFAAAHLPFGTSGSRGARTAVNFDLAW